MQRLATLILLGALTPTLSGCLVLRSKYNALDAERAALAESLEEEEAARAAAEGNATNVGAQYAAAEAQINEQYDQLETAEGSVRDAMQVIAEYRRLLDERGHQLQAALSVANAQSSETQELMDRLAELSALQTELDERSNLYNDLVSRFDELINAGTLDVQFVRGRMVLKLAQDILFEAGSADLGELGIATVTELAGVLATIGDRELQVEGHSDNIPIETRRFPSNWELSSARATAVVHVLTNGGVAPERISGAGFAEFRPVADNSTPEGRRLNRRIEIVIMPNLEVLFGSSGESSTPESSGAAPSGI